MIAGFWRVGVTSNQDEANMVHKVHKTKGSNVGTPILVNIEALKEGAKLSMYRAKAPSVALNEAQVTNKRARVGPSK